MCARSIFSVDMVKIFVQLKALLVSLRWRLSEERGQPALEYIAIAVVVVAGIVAALAAFGDEIEAEAEGLFSDIFDN